MLKFLIVDAKDSFVEERNPVQMFVDHFDDETIFHRQGSVVLSREVFVRPNVLQDLQQTFEMDHSFRFVQISIEQFFAFLIRLDFLFAQLKDRTSRFQLTVRENEPAGRRETRRVTWRDGTVRRDEDRPIGDLPCRTSAET